VWDSAPGSPGRGEALGHVDAEVAALVDAVRRTSRTVVLVSNEVGSGVVPEHESGRLYRDLLGRLNARVAAECDAVSLVVAGTVLPLTPGSSAAAP
jgi:adenosylcobinamide kinase/adenosylcobinamide-phosphate guanylyltransferase